MQSAAKYGRSTNDDQKRSCANSKPEKQIEPERPLTYSKDGHVKPEPNSLPLEEEGRVQSGKSSKCAHSKLPRHHSH
ncbi:hypothetical protein CDAR_471061 [Caerostris darwini]|uniref:Uncharacterized protein n=1 Tax=Caerostris darwini TaxID=1538125 RepID=A0AAV4QPX2_9ARAC|nr:hypothetical protein CDAR_471061 [Caerostris darwini]